MDIFNDTDKDARVIIAGGEGSSPESGRALPGLGRALRWLRDWQDKRQYQIAEAAGITKSLLSAYENGRHIPSADTLKRILAALDCDLSDLYNVMQIINGGPEGVRRSEIAPNDHAVVSLRAPGPWKVLFHIQGRKPLAEVVSSPKASLVLERTRGKYSVRASVAPIDALITYTPSVKRWAEKLDTALRENGLSTWIDFRDFEAGVSAWEQLEKAIDKTKNIVVLIGRKDDATERQRIAGAVALEAVDKDPNKRIIPLLLSDAELPVFVRAAAYWTRPIPAIRAVDPSRDWDRAVADLLEVLKSEVDPRAKGEVIDTAEEDRRLWRERMAYIKHVAAELKVQEDRVKRVSTKTA